MAEIIGAPIEGLIVGAIGHLLASLVKNVGEKIKHNPVLVILISLGLTIINPVTYYLFETIFLIVYLVKGGFKATWDDLKSTLTEKGKSIKQRTHDFASKVYDDQKKWLLICFIATFIGCFIFNLVAFYLFLETLPLILFLLGFFSTTIVGEIIGILGIEVGI
jgi:hypothetical protein